MKTIRICSSLFAVAFLMSSCSLFKPKYGCRSDGKNVGAEKIIDGTATKKPKKFKA